MQTPHNVVIPLQPDGKETARDARLLQVNDYVLWSMLSFTYANFCCMGFVAFLFSIKSQDHKVIGDVEGASSYGKMAKCLNIIVTIMCALFLVIIISLIATGYLYLSLNLGYKPQQRNLLLGWNQCGGK